MATSKQKKVALVVGVTALIGGGLLYSWYSGGVVYSMVHPDAPKTHVLKAGYQKQAFSPAIRKKAKGLTSRLPDTVRLATRRNEEFQQ